MNFFNVLDLEDQIYNSNYGNCYYRDKHSTFKPFCGTDVNISSISNKYNPIFELLINLEKMFYTYKRTEK